MLTKYKLREFKCHFYNSKSKVANILIKLRSELEQRDHLCNFKKHINNFRTLEKGLNLDPN